MALSRSSWPLFALVLVVVCHAAAASSSSAYRLPNISFTEYSADVFWVRGTGRSPGYILHDGLHFLTSVIPTPEYSYPTHPLTMLEVCSPDNASIVDTFIMYNNEACTAECINGTGCPGYNLDEELVDDMKNFRAVFTTMPADAPIEEVAVSYTGPSYAEPNSCSFHQCNLPDFWLHLASTGTAQPNGACTVDLASGPKEGVSFISFVNVSHIYQDGEIMEVVYCMDMSDAMNPLPLSVVTYDTAYPGESQFGLIFNSFNTTLDSSTDELLFEVPAICEQACQTGRINYYEPSSEGSGGLEPSPESFFDEPEPISEYYNGPEDYNKHEAAEAKPEHGTLWKALKHVQKIFQ